MWEKRNTLFVIVGFAILLFGISLMTSGSFVSIIFIAIGGIIFWIGLLGQRKYKGSKL